MKLSACVLLVVATAFAPARAATFSLAPVADTMVSSLNPASNYGGAGGISVAASGLARGEFQSLLRFDTTAAAASFDTTFGAGRWTIVSVTLQLTAAPAGNALFNTPAAGQINVGLLTGASSWVEGTGNPNNPATNGVTYSQLGGVLGPGEQLVGSFTFDGGATNRHSDPLVAEWDSVMADYLTEFRLYAPPGETGVAAVFNSRSFGTTTARPALIIEAVSTIPEPTSVALAAIVAIMALPLVRRQAR